MAFALRVLAGLHRAENAALICAFAALLVAAIVQIVFRNLFDIGFLWMESFLRILVLWVAMLGAMVATRERHHIAVDAIAGVLQGRWFHGARMTASLAAAAICLLVTWHATVFVTYEYQDGTIAFGQVPAWVCQAIMPFGFLVMGLRFLALGFGFLGHAVRNDPAHNDTLQKDALQKEREASEP